MLKLFAGKSRAANTQAFADQLREYEHYRRMPIKSCIPRSLNSYGAEDSFTSPPLCVAELENWSYKTTMNMKKPARA